MTFVIKRLLRLLARLLFVAAGTVFWVGGRIINQVAKIPRTSSEMEALGLAVILGALGLLAEIAARRGHAAMKG